MKFSVNILNFGPGTSAESMQRWAQLAEEAGYHLVMVSDLVALTADVQPLFPPPFYDPFVALGWLAAFTNKVEIGTTVTILPYRHPLLTAHIAANLEQLSHGRFILGVGVGWAKREFEALGVPFDRRGALANEYLEVIRIFFANEVASYDGGLARFSHAYTEPQPLRPAGLRFGWVAQAKPH